MLVKRASFAKTMRHLAVSPPADEDERIHIDSSQPDVPVDEPSVQKS